MYFFHQISGCLWLLDDNYFPKFLFPSLMPRTLLCYSVCHVLPPLSQLCSDVLDFLNLKTIATRRILRKDLFIVFEFEIKKNELEIFRIKYPAIACQLFIKLSTLLFISLTSFNVQGMMPIHMIHWVICRWLLNNNYRIQRCNQRSFLLFSICYVSSWKCYQSWLSASGPFPVTLAPLRSRTAPCRYHNYHQLMKVEGSIFWVKTLI